MAPLSGQFLDALENAGEFFEGRAPVQKAMERIIRLLDEMTIPYAVIGGLALNEIGYRHVTSNVDVLLPREDLDRFRKECMARGYVEKSARSVCDTENNVRIDVAVTGDYPGDGKPKAVRFPDPAAAAPAGRVRLLPLERLLELKLASGISAPHRLRDLADVLEVIRIRVLPRDFGEGLDDSVRAKYDELWVAAQSASADE